MASVAALMACAGGSKQAKPQSSTAPESAEAKAAAEQDKKDEAKLVCVWERPPGSNIAEKICRYPEQSEQEQKAIEQEATQRTIHSLPPVVQTNRG
jgi:mannitol-1-phosphate/altronate dehydrogenase